MTATTSAVPTPGSFLTSPAVDEAVGAIIAELRAQQEMITGVQPPNAEHAETYQGHLDRIGQLKGKPALYPYVGSGLGHGPLVQLCDGSVKYDMINGIGVHMFGHSDARMVETAIRAAMNDTVMQGNLQFNADSIDFAELLVNEAAKTSKIAHCFLTNSGANANETALKICYQKKDGKSPRVIAFADCFMGRTTTMCQIGDSAAARQGIPLNVDVDYMPFWDPEHGERAIEYAKWHLQQYIDRYPGQHACFVFELVQGEGGFNVAPREYLLELMKMCRENDIPVWADEIQTFGRNERMFYFEQLDLGEYIDVVTLGKMSQVCACLYTEQIAPKPGLLSGTFIGSTVGLHVGRRILETLRDEGYYGPDGRIAKLQQAFRERAQKLVDDHPDWFPPVPHYSGIRRQASGLFGGVGGMMRFTPFGGEKAKVWKTLHTMFEKGVIAFACGHGPYHIRFLPPVGVMKAEHFDEVFPIVEASLAEVAAAG